MKVLLIKTSSMGDILHTFPAISDASQHIPKIQFDWIIEDNFSTIPTWHKSVDQIIPVKLRKWRKQLFSPTTYHDFKQLKHTLANQEYDLIIDAQGLLKSAWLTYLTKGIRAGFDFYSARERLAAFFYHKRFAVAKQQHAITRLRQLFSLALNYPMPQSLPCFNLEKDKIIAGHRNTQPENQPYLFFLHGTTWSSKQWPIAYWIELAKLCSEKGYHIKIGGFSHDELTAAKHIATACSAVSIEENLSIAEMAAWLAQASGVIAVDTGFGHLAAALNVPTLSLYGASRIDLTSTVGAHTQSLSAHFPCSPCLQRRCSYQQASPVFPACYQTITPGRVFQTLQSMGI